MGGGGIGKNSIMEKNVKRKNTNGVKGHLNICRNVGGAMPPMPPPPPPPPTSTAMTCCYKVSLHIQIFFNERFDEYLNVY